MNKGLLEKYSGAAAAFSVRLLNRTYTGPLLKIRRVDVVSSQDNGEIFVFPDSTGWISLDSRVDDPSNVSAATTLGEFVNSQGHAQPDSGTIGSNPQNAFVSIWKDQSGNANDASQDTTTSQPQIVSIGVVMAESGKPAVTFDNSDFLSFNSRIYTARTMVAVLKMTTFIYNRLCSNSVEIQNISNGWVNGGGGSDTNEKFNINAVSINGVVDSTSPYGSNLIGLYNLSYFTGNGVDSNGLGEIGWHAPNRSLLGKLQELILYPNEDTDNRTNIENNINSYFNIYP